VDKLGFLDLFRIWCSRVRLLQNPPGPEPRADFGLGVLHGGLCLRHHLGGEVGVGHAMYLLPVLADLLHDLVLGHAGCDEVAVRAYIATGD